MSERRQMNPDDCFALEDIKSNKTKRILYFWQRIKITRSDYQTKTGLVLWLKGLFDHKETFTLKDSKSIQIILLEIKDIQLKGFEP